MKYLLMIYMNDDVFEALSEEERNAVFAGHDAFAPKIRESGEFIRTAARSSVGTERSTSARTRSRRHWRPRAPSGQPRASRTIRVPGSSPWLAAASSTRPAATSRDDTAKRP